MEGKGLKSKASASAASSSSSSKKVKLCVEYGQFGHSSTGLPILQGEETDADSEGEPDPEWLRVNSKMAIDEFIDVNDAEKEMMKLWNLYIMKCWSVGDGQIQLVCKNFVERHGQDIIRKNLCNNFSLHLTNLYDWGLLTARQVHANVEQLQQMIISPRNLKTLLTGAHDGVLRHSLETAASNWCPEREPTIAIDFGMTYSRVAVFQDTGVATIKNALGEDVTPSYLAFNRDGTSVVGQAAKEKADTDPGSTLFKLKSLMGDTLPPCWVTNPSSPVRLILAKSGHEVEVHGRRFHLKTIVSILFRELKAQAERFLGRRVENAVITVPAYFTEKQIVATAMAATHADLNVISILYEPVAALIAYQPQLDADVRNVLVFDWGCQMLGLAILKLNPNNGTVNVLHADEDWSFGSSKFDTNMLNYCFEEFGTLYDIRTKKDRSSKIIEKGEPVRQRRCRLLAACEKARVDLDTQSSVIVELDSFFGGKDLSVRISREVFEDMNKRLYQKIIVVLEKALRAAGVQKEEIHDILPVGASSRTPKVQNILREYFNGKALNNSVPPNYPVVYGAAIHGAILKETATGITTRNNGERQAEPNEAPNPCEFVVLQSTYSHT